MNALHQPVKRAQRRLWLNRFLSALGWSLAAAGCPFVLAVAADRIWIASERAGAFFGLLALVLAALALITSATWTVLTRETLATAAARLDIAAGLKERLSSALFCEETTDPFAQAVVTDARRLSGSVSVPQHIPFRVPRSAGYAGGTLSLALLFFWLFPTLDLSGHQAQHDQQLQKNDLIKRTEAQIKPALEQAFKNLGDKNPALKKELDGLEPLKQANLDKPLDVYNQAIKQVNGVRQALENKANNTELAKVSELKKMLRQLTSPQQTNSPVSTLAKALAKGDFKSAQSAIKALQQELSKKPQTREQQQRADELKKQLDQLSKQIEKIAQNESKLRGELAKANLTEKEIAKALENLHKKDLQALKKQLADKGLSKEQIEKLMQQVEKRSAACSAANKLSKNLAQGAQGSGKMGQLSESASQALSAAGQQLSEMEATQQELNQILSASADLDALKDQLGQSCPVCNGTGMINGQSCSACQGTGMGKGGHGTGMAGLGQGEGNIAPRQETAFKTVQKRTRVNTLPGSIVSQKFVDGEQYAGEVSDDFVDAVISAKRDITDATPIKPLPRVYHKTRAQYFSHAVEDLPADKVKAAQGEAEEQPNPKEPAKQEQSK